ncbi:response regulator [Myxococcota bacterium]|nr:response regulator [Myxococcota bacterium]MBU1899594.1 response regulator [Myxococcota bacterium]
MKNLAYLVAEDSQVVRHMVRNTIIDRFGSQSVYTAHDGALALSILANKKIDIIISDWEMPRLTGQELLVYVRRSKSYRNTPFIMMTSRICKTSVVSAIQAGVSYYIAKPFTTKKLEDVIRDSWFISSKRKDIRIALPNHHLKFSVNGENYFGKVIDISESGLLFEAIYVSSLSLFEKISMGLTVQFSNGQIFKINELLGSIVRIETHNNSQILNINKPCKIAIKFDFDAGDENKAKTKFLVDKAIEERLNA